MPVNMSYLSRERVGSSLGQGICAAAFVRGLGESVGSNLALACRQHGAAVAWGQPLTSI